MLTSQAFSTPTTAMQIADSLREEVNMGRLDPGVALRQEDIAARFGVSRIPVREAFGRLEREGLLIVQPNRGAFVSSPSGDEIQEIFELRLLLEPDALGRAVPLHTPRSLRNLEAIQRELDVEDDPQHWLKLDQSFHSSLYEPSGRIRTLAFISSLRASVNRYYLRLFTPDANRGAWNREHHSIIDRLAHEDAEGAATALRFHLKETLALTLSFLAKGPYRAAHSDCTRPANEIRSSRKTTHRRRPRREAKAIPAR